RSSRSQAPAALAAYLVMCGAGATALAIAGCGAEAEAEAAQATTPERRAEIPSDYNPSKSLAPMIQAVAPSVVAVYTQSRTGGTQGSGSGFIYTSNGLVVTNHHVVDGAAGVQVRLADGQRFEAQVLGSDEATDLAVLRLIDASELPAVTLGDSHALAVGDWVVAIGNPMGLDHSASVGIISGKGRGSLGLYRDSYLDFLQTDADIAPGSSGGPLFDFEGSVVGVTTAVGAGSRPGFAIPVDTVRRIVGQLEKNGRVARGWLGAASVEGEEDIRGARLGNVYEDTPAHSAGLRQGDLILAVDDDAIVSFTELRSRIATTEPGHKVALKVDRDGTQLLIDVTLEERPPQPALGRLRPANPLAEAPRRAPRAADAPTLPFGITLPQHHRDRDEASSRSRLGVQARADAAGMEVVEVEPNSLAATLGLEPGDRMTEINGEAVPDAAAVARALAKDERKVTIRFERDGAPHRVTLERS
ncbi:MAG: trypsin-like peptidase domain-containing protein, partial [Nannocystaceae bacterium]|nr:trypsin-like peptidase domain-containing protein [Nannocystaceae bacterium]